jgi:hypothetical protein
VTARCLGSNCQAICNVSDKCGPFYAVPEVDNLIDVPTTEVVDDSFEGRKVAVDVRDDGAAH